MRRAMLKAALALALSAPMAVQAGTPLRMNDIQVVGSHNSFKAQIPAPILDSLRARDPRLAEALDYYHLPLSAQLDAGVRQVEIDIFADPAGGRYAHPAGEACCPPMPGGKGRGSTRH
jgi:hypothetical protein